MSIWGRIKHSTASRVHLHLVWSDRMVCLEAWCLADSVFGLSMPADPILTWGASPSVRVSFKGRPPRKAYECLLASKSTSPEIHDGHWELSCDCILSAHQSHEEKNENLYRRIFLPKLSTFPPVRRASSIKRPVNVAPSYRPAFIFVIRDNIAFAMLSTGCAGSRDDIECLRQRYLVTNSSGGSFTFWHHFRKPTSMRSRYNRSNGSEGRN